MPKNESNQQKIARVIEQLLQYALQHQLIGQLDLPPARNALLDLFQIDEPYHGQMISEVFDRPTELLEKLLDLAGEIGLLAENTTTYRDLLDARIMGLLMPRQSETAAKFRETAKQVSMAKATEDFYQLSIDSNYIRMDRIQKNKYWIAETEYGALEITINLSKPEKNPREIALLRSMPQNRYPQCLLCLENVGYMGRLNHPARQNLRVIPVQLNGDPWYLQYSPYVYYNEHCIIFNQEHRPMQISHGTFVRLLDFVEQFPHYFAGSNADLPIVGGSILNHDHYQGGRHTFPMEKAPVEHSFTHPDYPGVKAGLVKWPMSVIRLAGRNKAQFIQLADVIFETWKSYSDLTADIVAFTEIDGSNVPHNTVTPIARINQQGEFELDLVLRNNRTNEQHPDGIFHPHQELHHIKKENIGLIEVMGLAVLPGRLQMELAEMEQILTGEKPFAEQIRQDPNHALFKHTVWISDLLAEYGNSLTKTNAQAVLKKEVGKVFTNVLLDAGVYKRNPTGLLAFQSFLWACGFKSAHH